jgi:hypothetical protein
MKRIAVIVGLGLFLALPSWMMAQENRSALGENHGEVGAYFDYLRWSPASTTTNFVGAGRTFVIQLPLQRGAGRRNGLRPRPRLHNHDRQ